MLGVRRASVWRLLARVLLVAVGAGVRRDVEVRAVRRAGRAVGADVETDVIDNPPTLLRLEHVAPVLGVLGADRPPGVHARHRFRGGEGEQVGVVVAELGAEGLGHPRLVEEREERQVVVVPGPVAVRVGAAGAEVLVRVADVRRALAGPEEDAAVVGFEAELRGGDPGGLDLVLEVGLSLGVDGAAGGEGGGEGKGECEVAHFESPCSWGTWPGGNPGAFRHQG